MLPDHVFADVVGFLHFYDLDALLMTDTRRTALAHYATANIRVFDYSKFDFTLTEDKIVAENLTNYNPLVTTFFGPYADTRTTLTFNSTAELLQFVTSALRNCVLHSMTLTTGATRPPTWAVAQAIKEVARTIVINFSLFIDARGFPTLKDVVDFAASFRSVRNVFIRGVRREDEHAQLQELLGHVGFGNAWRTVNYLRVSYEVTPRGTR
ncbi:hypothetical protein AAVH_02220 [Aphelenchoides avenae]|nr:hypothetical protein AAVH_02220 [Aphelenchus avenae]